MMISAVPGKHLSAGDIFVALMQIISVMSKKVIDFQRKICYNKVTK